MREMDFSGNADAALAAVLAAVASATASVEIKRS
jgi:hypothetical protein